MIMMMMMTSGVMAGKIIFQAYKICDWKFPILAKFKSEIKILITRKLSCRKSATFCFLFFYFFKPGWRVDSTMSYWATERDSRVFITSVFLHVHRSFSDCLPVSSELMTATHTRRHQLRQQLARNGPSRRSITNQARRLINR